MKAILTYLKMQNFKNHIKFYPLHHFVFYPTTVFLSILFIYLAVDEVENRKFWLSLFVVIFIVTWLSFMLRQHYSLTNQNRIIRLEMRFRFYVLTHKQLEDYENKLSFGQIAALRFASDQELPGLLDIAIRENLSPVQIKQSIKVWKADLMRV